MTVTVTGSLLRAGQEPNDATVVIQDALEQDMTPNYQITVEAGTLKIIPIVLKFKTDSAEKIYDGVALTAKGCELVEGELVKGHTLSFAAVGTQTNAGSSQNTLSVTVKVFDETSGELVYLAEWPKEEIKFDFVDGELVG